MNKTVIYAIGIIVVLLAAWFLWSSMANSGASNGSNTQVSTTTSSTSSDNGRVSTTRRNADVATIASSITGASQFASWFSSTGVKSSITGAGPYTIFVPTDGAVSLLPKGTITGMTAAEKKALVQYHIVKGRAIDPAGIESGSIASLSGDALNFEVSDIDETARVNSAFIVKAYQGSNGVVYLISGVLLPPTGDTQEQL